jgi:hypothetical protein
MRVTDISASRFSDPEATISKMLRLTLQFRCSELAVFLLRGQEAPELLEEIADMAADCWALRDGDDT